MVVAVVGPEDGKRKGERRRAKGTEGVDRSPPRLGGSATRRCTYVEIRHYFSHLTPTRAPATFQRLLPSNELRFVPG